MANEMNYTYDAKFEGNILVVGKTGCGKTRFVQNLEKNRMFSDIKEVLWVSKISLSVERENDISGCLTEQKIGFKYLNDVNDFDDLLDSCQIKKSPCNENYFGENMVLDSLIVMDDVSGLAEKSEAFANFLTISRKFGIMCLCFSYNLPYEAKLEDDTFTDKNN